MNIRIHWTLIIFLLAQSAIAAIFFPILFPNVRFVFFAPLQAFLFIRSPLVLSLWVSLFIGLFLDCTTTSFPFGIHTILCVAIAFLMYGRKKHFFEEKIFSWVLYSALISSLYTALLFFCNLLVNVPPPLSLRGIFSDMVIMAIIDGIYTLIWFKLPMYIINRLQHLFVKDPSYEIPLKS
ncbi:MAG: hypothetical protein ACRCSV_04455 [Chlamydiales bacterium]